MTATITATPNPVHEGATLHICYDDTSRAGETVTLEMDNGEGESETKQVALDSNGHGCFDWTVPQWDLIQINGPDAEQETVFTTP